MERLDEILRKGTLASDHRPWPRVLVAAEVWYEAIAVLASGRWQLLGLWGEAERVHVALRDEADERIAVVTLD